MTCSHFNSKKTKNSAKHFTVRLRRKKNKCERNVQEMCEKRYTDQIKLISCCCLPWFPSHTVLVFLSSIESITLFTNFPFILCGRLFLFHCQRRLEIFINWGRLSICFFCLFVCLFGRHQSFRAQYTQKKSKYFYF